MQTAFARVIRGWDTPGVAERFGHFKEPGVPIACKQQFFVHIDSSTSKAKSQNFNDS